MAATDNRLLLVSLLQHERVSTEELLGRYHAFLMNLKALCLVVPNSPCYLEVWPPAFESHNIAFGALFYRSLNSASKQMQVLLSVAGVAASLFDECPYLQAGNVVAAAKHGTPQDKLMALFSKSHDALSAEENLVVGVVEALCTKPQPTLTKEQKSNFERTFGRRAEQIAGAVFAFGYLAKFMDAVVVELEQPIADIAHGTIAKYGWSAGAHGWKLDPAAQPQPLPKRDRFFTRLKNMRYIPGTISYVSGLEKGVPSKWPKLQRFLKHRTGHDFPFMERIHTPHMRKGLGALLARNLDPQTSVSGLAVKCLLGMMFATFSRCPLIEDAVRDMSVKFEVSNADLEKAKAFMLDDQLDCDEFSNKQVRAMLVLGKAVLPTPCKVVPEVVEHLRRVDIGASVIVELVTWVSLLEMLQRISFYYFL